MKKFYVLAAILVVVGALNWGLLVVAISTWWQRSSA